MIGKVVFFRYLPLTKKVYEDFYLPELKDAGFEVEYWYLPFVIKVPDGVESFEHPCVRVLSSYADLRRQLKSCDYDTTLFISIQTYDGLTLRLFWTMTRCQCRMGVFGRNMFPVPKKIPPGRSGLARFSPARLWKSGCHRLVGLLKQHGLLRSYDVLFLGGRFGISGYGFVSDYERNRSVHVLVNSNDYDSAMRAKALPRVVAGRYIVFLDECLPLHPDIRLCGIRSVSPDRYYAELSAFFDRIERERGMKVIVAAHPKSLIYKKRDFFSGRQVIFGETARLVRDAELVLAHDSTAIGYAVTFGKPILSMTSSAIEREQPTTHYATVELSRYLGTPLVYVDACGVNCRQEAVIPTSQVDQSKYLAYTYDYLTNPETRDSMSCDLVIRGLRSM